MSSSSKNDLQSVEKNSDQAPEGVVMIEPPPETRSTIENTAFWVSKHGLWFEHRIVHNLEYVVDITTFSFLKWSDPYHAFYMHKIAEYRNVQQNQDAESEPPVPLRLTCVPGGVTFTLKELDIVHLTAMFVSVYGMHFQRDLIKSVFLNPKFESLFQFVKSTDCRHSFFVERALEYSSRFQRSRNGASTATVLEGFFKILSQVLENEEEQGENLAIKYFGETKYQDLYQSPYGRTMNPPTKIQYPFGSKFSVDDMEFAVGGLDALRNTPWYDGMVSQRKEYNDWLMSKKRENNPGSEIQFTTAPRRPITLVYSSSPLPFHEEPIPKGLKFSESTLVPEDKFIAQTPAPFTVKVAVTKVIEIELQSLSEKVATLKEKIAGEIQIPANKQKLCGRAGLLEDNMSLAHYNVGAGETLTLSVDCD